MERSDRRLNIALGIGLAGLALVPWYRTESGFFGLGWFNNFPTGTAEAPALVQVFEYGRWTLAIITLILIAGLAARAFRVSALRCNLLIAAGAIGIVFLVLQGLAVGFTGWTWTISENLFGPLADGQPSMGAGAGLVALSFVLMFSFGLAERGVLRGDAFVVASIALLVFLVSIFVFYPVGSMFVGAFQSFDGSFDPSGIARREQVATVLVRLLELLARS